MRLDTIVAPITGNQPAAVAIVRLSGPDAWEVGSRLFKRWPPAPVSHHAIYGRVSTGDEALALPFAEGHSYTGEEAVEFSIHGSPASVRALVEACLREGSRMADPGEFTQRAFMNGRMDLSQAEGVRDTITAVTDAQLRQAHLHRNGVLSTAIGSLAEEVSRLLAAVEASVDFSEEIGDFDRPAGLSALQKASAETRSLLSTAAAGRILREGLRIAILGRPNAGKSSLLNLLLGTDRAIVTEIPGTTRDYVEESVDLGGVLCVLTDTAGLRESEDRIETIGVKRSLAVAERADEIWYLYDSSIGWTDADDQLLDSLTRPVLILANKSDLLPSAAQRQGALPISAVQGVGTEALAQHVARFIDGADERPFVNTRHAYALEGALEGIESAIQALRHELPEDLVSVGLREALSRFGEITGETATADILERIFHDFCIGK